LRLRKVLRERSIDEMRDAAALIKQILFLEGVPTMQRLGPPTPTGWRSSKRRSSSSDWRTTSASNSGTTTPDASTGD
jgi:hypothetical protein